MKYRIKCGLSDRRAGRTPKKLNGGAKENWRHPDVVARLRKRIEEGATVAQLAGHHGMTRRGMRYVLKRLNLKVRFTDGLDFTGGSFTLDWAATYEWRAQGGDADNLPFDDDEDNSQNNERIKDAL